MTLAEYEAQQDMEWDRSIEVEQRVEAILADAQELDDAIGDVIWSGPDSAQENYARLLCRLATASDEEWARLRGEFQELHRDIAMEYAENDIPLPSLLRRQAE
jgi:hypothetical protein